MFGLYYVGNVLEVGLLVKLVTAALIIVERVCGIDVKEQLLRSVLLVHGDANVVKVLVLDDLLRRQS